MKTATNDLPLVRKWLLEDDFNSIQEYARRKKGILSLLTALSYDPNPKISDGAVIATGRAAQQIAQRDPEYVRNYLLRLFWLVNEESGGICWHAPDLIENILMACPQFDHFQPMLVSLRNSETKIFPSS